MKEIFLITSHGWSSSSWIANILNEHERIWCSHLLIYRKPLRDDNDKNLTTNRFFDEIRDEAISRLNTPIEQTSHLILNASPTDYTGNVGFYRLRDLEPLINKYGGSTCNIKLLNLIRDPIAVVLSGYAQFLKRFTFDIHELHWNLGKLLEFNYEFVSYISEKYDLELGNIENLAFFSAAQTLASLRADVDAQHSVKNLHNIQFGGNIRMEDITSSPNKLRSVFNYLTPKVKVNDQYIESALAIGAINSHRQHDIQQSTEQRYNALKPWQKETIKHLWDRCQLDAFYTEHEYTFPYL